MDELGLEIAQLAQSKLPRKSGTFLGLILGGVERKGK